MQSQAITFDLTSLMTGGKSTTGKSALDGVFEALLSQASQGGIWSANATGTSGSRAGSLVASDQTTRAATAAASSTTATQTDNQATIVGRTSATPIERLRQSLQASGEPLENYSVPAGDRETLKETLVKSGYSEDDAEEVLTRATQDDGSVNLGSVFAILPQYTPAEGPVFTLASGDLPLLSQVLKDLGVADQTVREYVESLPRHGDQVTVSGLPKVLAQATASSDGYQVDQDTLADLLGKLGLDESQVATLLAQSGDSQGHTNPQAMLALLKVAANQQNGEFTASLKGLASRLQISPAQGSDAGNQLTAAAAQLRDKVVQILAASGQTETGTTELKELFKSALGEASKTLDGLLATTTRATATTTGGQDLAATQAAASATAAKSGTATGRETGQAAEVAGREPSAVNGSASPLNRVETTQAGAQTGFGLGQNSGQASATTAAGQTRSPLPAHVVQQVAEQMAQMAKTQTGNLRLQLTPADLGELNLTLSVKDGTVSAVVMAETAAAKSALDAGAEQLKQTLAAQGLKVERLEILVNPDAQEQSQAQSGEGQRRGGDQRHLAGGNRPAAVAGAAQATENSENLAREGERINLFA